jgi:hypothetical protein
LARLLPYVLAALLVIALTAFATAKLTNPSKPASSGNLGTFHIASTGRGPQGPPDSLAPAGAPRKWLPNYDWVMEHWMPYDQQQLFSTLGVTLTQVQTYLASGPLTKPVRPLAGLISSKGLNPQKLANQLVSAWHPPRAMYAMLVSRAMETFTQGHLMQHMLFHFFHDRALNKATPQIFNVTPKQLQQYLVQGMKRYQVGLQHGRTYQQMVAATAAVLRAEEAVGVRDHLTSPSEAQEELTLQIARIPAWLKDAGANVQATVP